MEPETAPALASAENKLVPYLSGLVLWLLPFYAVVQSLFPVCIGDDSGAILDRQGEAMTLRCECGGTVRADTASSFDFSLLAGLPVQLEGAPCMRCKTCGLEMLSGEVIKAVCAVLTHHIFHQPGILSPAEFRICAKNSI